MYRGSVPCWVDESGVSHELERVRFQDKQITEGHLQDLLNRNPNLLPISELDSSFSPAVSLGREIGNFDNLFLSPSGRITLVETKLWRNPEATRQVVAQILDYAAKLSSWSYAELQTHARSASPPAPIGAGSLYDLISTAHPDETPQEERFIDEVEKTLRTARFMLLVVGDGIRENVESLVGMLHQYPQMLFTFGLVELQIYHHPSAIDGRLIVPQIVLNTTEVVRAVVRVHTSGQANVSVEIEETDPDKPTPSKRRTLSEEQFLSEVADPEARALFLRLLRRAEELGAVPVWRSSGVSIRLPDPAGSRQNMTLFVMTTSGQIYIGWLATQLERVSLNTQIAHDFAADLARLFTGVVANASDTGSLSRVLDADEVDEQYDAFVGVVSATISRIRGAAEVGEQRT